RTRAHTEQVGRRAGVLGGELGFRPGNEGAPAVHASGGEDGDGQRGGAERLYVRAARPGEQGLHLGAPGRLVLGAAVELERNTGLIPAVLPDAEVDPGVRADGLTTAVGEVDPAAVALDGVLGEEGVHQEPR